VPEPSEKAVHFYRSGVVWWLVTEGWSQQFGITDSSG
jgi:hypothetical protein